MIGTVWADCWLDCWTDCWADAVTPPIATLILGAISIRPLLGASLQMKTALSGDIDAGPLLAGKIRTDD
ncbi:hypothetical protein ASD12_18070 [Mesorhizobium sp. Root102]|uniref:hypothetical protein n=1 Tax=Mesorhizobium sp. Root102 TaxID=1736422 RepID=UPI0006F71460|nr:hypothetical protein [Mesorhizobium sp. Root102]KQU77707.1 hypothetical protein ASD12_18070 [Mesorhizobium sp. Root102]